MDTSSQWFDYLHNTRSLSPDVIKEAKLTNQLGRLRIPIIDQNGEELFAKLRRPQHATWGPKYMYEKGSHATLYGLHFSDLGGPLVLAEGELEVLALRTLGVQAYSSTGGAMTFKSEWLELLPPDRPIIILFDNDDAGIKGAIKVAQMIGVGSYTWVPPMYGKDVGDILQSQELLMVKNVLFDPERIVTFDVRSHNQATRNAVYKKLTDQAKMLDQSIGKKFLLELAFQYRPIKKVKRKWSDGDSNMDSLIERARHYPIENLLPIQPNQKICCLWHREKTPSLHLWRDNRLFCYGGCNKMYDAIAVYMKLYDVKFKDAVEALNRM